MNWLTNIPTSALDIDRKYAHKEVEQQKINRLQRLKTESETIKVETPIKSKSSYSSYQSPIGMATDIAIFGVPLGVFK
ncbi:hypothetical protein [Escherichia phage UPEC01]|nr:hypothetical protein [Escherichia phage UPEC01]